MKKIEFSKLFKRIPKSISINEHFTPQKAVKVEIPEEEQKIIDAIAKKSIPDAIAYKQDLILKIKLPESN